MAQLPPCLNSIYYDAGLNLESDVLERQEQSTPDGYEFFTAHSLIADVVQVGMPSLSSRDEVPKNSWLDALCAGPKVRIELNRTTNDLSMLVYPQPRTIPEAFNEFRCQFFQPFDGPKYHQNAKDAVDYYLRINGCDEPCHSTMVAGVSLEND